MILCIVGLGLLGGSFSLAIQEKYRGVRVIGVDSNPRHADKALELGIAHEISSLKEAVGRAQVTVLATPVNILLTMLPEVLDNLPDSAVVMDLGSTKELICKAVAEHPKRKQYVAAHPIAGTENSGPEAAFAALLRNKTMILCEPEKSNPLALLLIESICSSLEMNVTQMNAAEHDQHLAYVSHLSHVSSFALGATVLDKEKDVKSIFDMAGSGFSSTVRLAQSSPAMWAPIFTQNTKNVSEALGSYIVKLQEFKQVIDAQDEQESTRIMSHANQIRGVLKGIENGKK
jgi:prephenate dehydrogenase